MSCVICQNPIEQFDINIKICGSDDCEFKSRTIYMNDNYIYNFVNKNKLEAEFLLYISKHSKDRFNPKPYFLDDNYDISDLVLSINIKEDINNIMTMGCDELIYSHFGKIKYGLLKFIFKSNQINIRSKDIFNIKDLKTFEVIDNSDLDLKNTTYLFHGSPLKNWYSIMMNGLKVCSNTSMMAHGASFGTGIYLSDDFNMSFGYSTRNNINNNFILGVFIVKGDISQYIKARNVYVVNNQKNVFLKYIIWGKNNISTNNFNIISTKFNKNIIKEKKEEIEFLSTFKNKRLIKEIMYVNTANTDQYGLKFIINDENMYIWNVNIYNIDTNTNLYKDMQILGIDHIKMEIRFPNNYPLKAPFVRVISPIFQYQTGHICTGGSICSELLSDSGWSPVYSTESLFIQIKSNILEGEGRLNLNKKNYTYSYQEALESHKRVMTAHGW